VAIDDANGRTGPRAAEQTMILNVENRGWQSVRIVGAGDDRAGVRTLRATVDNAPLTPQSPYVVDPGGTVKIALVLQFTDCWAVSDQPWPIPIRVARPWGTHAIHVFHRPIRAASDRGGWSVTDRGDPHAVEWQRWIADDICAIPYGKRSPGYR
jgi:hypothetical protein